MDFSVERIHVEVVDFIDEIDSWRILWVVRRESDYEGECEMGIGGVSELRQVDAYLWAIC